MPATTEGHYTARFNANPKCSFEEGHPISIQIQATGQNLGLPIEEAQDLIASIQQAIHDSRLATIKTPLFSVHEMDWAERGRDLPLVRGRPPDRGRADRG